MLAFEISDRFDDIIRQAEEFHVATGRSDIARDDLFGRETRKIIRATGLRPCPGQPLAAERLGTDHSTDLIAIDVNVTDLGMITDVIRNRLNAAVNAEGQSIAGLVDRRADLVEMALLIAKNM